MSIILQKFSAPVLAFPLVFFFVQAVFSQNAPPPRLLRVEISLTAETGIVRVRGKFTEGNSKAGENWSFANSYADAENLAARIKNFELFGAGGERIEHRKFADGEFVAQAPAGGFSYEVDLRLPANKSLMAHISWLDAERGMILPGDLFPQISDGNFSQRVKFELPPGWIVSTAAERTGGGEFIIRNAAETVFFIGRNQRERRFMIENANFGFVISGEWQFTDEEASEMARGILEEYREIFGRMPFPSGAGRIFLVRFPAEVEAGRWRAETRGVNAVILSSSMPFKAPAAQRLHEQLRHELFHLWIPNALNLSGDYSWFYEGFAVYQALKTGVWTGQIRFEDFLNTVSESYNIHRRAEGNFPLIDVSKNLWRRAEAGASVYSKGLLVAFLSDLALLEKSRGKRDIKLIFRELFRNFGSRSAPAKDANESVLKILGDFEELNEIIEKFIKGTEKIDLAKYLSRFGIENTGSVNYAKFAVKSDLRGREKAILEKLGYNKWRKILRRS